MYKYIYPLIKWKIKPWLKYYIVKKGEGTPSEIITSASPITLVNSLRKKFIKFIVGGNSIQDGEPSPTNEIPIQNVTGDAEVKVENKNLFTTTDNLVSVTTDTNCEIIGTNEINVISTGTRYTYRNAKFKIENLIVGKTYYIQANFSNSDTGYTKGPLYIRNKADTATLYANDNYVSGSIVSFVPTETTANIKFYANSGIARINTCKWSNIMISEFPNFNFISHEEQTAIFPLEEGQILHEGDTIEDKIVQRRKTLELNGTENWQMTITSRFYIKVNDLKLNLNEGLCSHFKVQALTNKNGITFSYGGSKNIYIYYDEALTASEFKAWLAEQYANGTPVTLEYELETPIEIPFTEAQRTAKAQIDKLYSYKGTTHISSTNDPSPIFEVQYYMEGE